MLQNGVSWTQLTAINLFADSNSAIAGKKLYPGVSGSYAFNVSNPGPSGVTFIMRIAETAHDAGSIPLEYRLKRTGAASYIAGSATSYLTPAQLSLAAASLDAGESIGYTLEWRWPFESGNDALDTALGSNANRDHLVTVTIHVEQTV